MGWVKYSTVGAKAGTDLKESDGTVLTDNDVKNTVAITAAASDASTKATAAQTAAASDATTKATAAQTAAASDASTKATAAQTAAASDASTKATAAQTAAASDATTKADAAKAIETANRFTIASDSTEGRFSYKIGGGTTVLNNVFSSGERDKLTYLRAGTLPGGTGSLESTSGSQTKATAAQTAAATDASTKATAAQTAAATDASTKATAAQTAAATDASTKATAAQTAAASDASTKATAAQTAAASDATTKADAAEADAVTTAASDATTKADAAKAIEVANRFTLVTDATEGRFGYKIGGGTTAYNDVFSSAERTKLTNLRAGNDANGTFALVNYSATGNVIHADNYTNSQYTSSDFTITALTGFSADTYANANIGKTLKTSLLHANWNGINGTAYTPDIGSNASDTQDVTITMEGNGIEVTGTWRWTAYNSAAGADKITDGAWVGGTPTGFSNPAFTGGTTLTKTVTFVVDSQYTNPVPISINSAILNLSIGGGGKSDVRLKENINRIGTYKGYNIYTWTWNKLAKLLGVADPTIGVLAQEVQQTNPEAVIMENDGYLAVNYKSIFGDQNGN